MKNIYVERMRKILKSYLELQTMTNTEIKKNNDTYAFEYAEKYNQPLKDKKLKDYQDARQEINRTYEKVRELLAKASFPISQEMTKDAELFTNPYIQLTDEEIEAMAVEYRDSGNHTMLRIIDNWCTKHEKHDLALYLPYEQLMAYKKIAESALFTINGIFGEEKAHFVDLEIEYFADPVMCKNEMDTIGSGKGLQNNENKEVPETILHRYDNVILKMEDPVLATVISSDSLYS